jgi:hypothetical protein
MDFATGDVSGIPFVWQHIYVGHSCPTLAQNSFTVPATLLPTSIRVSFRACSEVANSDSLAHKPRKKADKNNRDQSKARHRIGNAYDMFFVASR